jgi:hypothetical protein
MQFQDGPDKVQVSRYASGALIAIGVPWDKGLFIQEYWVGARPYYSIANTSSESIEVGIYEWNRGVGKRLLGPWTITADSVECYAVDALVTDYSGSLVAVSLNNNLTHGLLKRPRPISKPPHWENLEGVLTIDGINGVGDRDANLLFLQEEIRFISHETTSLKLHVPENIGTISFKDSFRASYLPQIVVLEAISDTLPVERLNKSFIIYSHETSKHDSGDVTLTVQLPEADVETMAALLGHVTSPHGAGFSFGRGLIVTNRG